MFETVRWDSEKGCVRIIDQRRLPGELVYREIFTIDQVFDAIKTLAVRGAPAIGIAGAYGMALVTWNGRKLSLKDLKKRLQETAVYLESSRPTAVNLSWAVRGLLRLSENEYPSADVLAQAMLQEADRVLEEDLELSRAMGKHGAALIQEGMGVLTHCNAGGLATGGLGTALAVMYEAHSQGKRFTVYADETRPLLQGARLTAWELTRAGIDTVLICDSMAASVMAQGKIGLVITGADRIARNGDTANKIGTYGLAVLAGYHGIPLYIAAPYSTFDVNISDGDAIPIEEREPKEVRSFRDCVSAPRNVTVYNPAFDVTPATLITGIITEKGIFGPPYDFKG